MFSIAASSLLACSRFLAEQTCQAWVRGVDQNGIRVHQGSVKTHATQFLPLWWWSCCDQSRSLVGEAIVLKGWGPVSSNGWMSSSQSLAAAAEAEAVCRSKSYYDYG